MNNNNNNNNRISIAPYGRNFRGAFPVSQAPRLLNEYNTFAY